MNNQLAECLIGFAQIANAEKSLERAATLLGAAEMQFEARQFPLENIDQSELKRLMTILREDLGDAEIEALVAKGQAMTMEQAIVYALGPSMNS